MFLSLTLKMNREWYGNNEFEIVNSFSKSTIRFEQRKLGIFCVKPAREEWKESDELSQILFIPHLPAWSDSLTPHFGLWVSPGCQSLQRSAAK